MILALTDKVIIPYLDNKEYIDCSNEAECIAMAAGYYLATGNRADVYFSADGLCNALNYITSWIIPDGIEMNITISTGRTEDPHIVMTTIYDKLLKLLDYDPKRIHIETVRKI